MLQEIKQPKWSILICSIEERSQLLAELLEELETQIEPYQSLIEILVLTDNKQISIGKKRQMLLNRSSGKYICYVDDDDWIDPDYIAAIISTIMAYDPDCIGFKMTNYRHGEEDTTFDLKLQKPNNPHEEDPVWAHGHLLPVKAELAKQIGFKDKWTEEDMDYSEALRPLIRSQMFLEHVLYHRFWEKKGA